MSTSTQRRQQQQQTRPNSRQTRIPGRHTLSRSLLRSSDTKINTDSNRRRSLSKSSRRKGTRGVSHRSTSNQWQDPEELDQEFEEALKELELSDIASRHELGESRQSLGERLEELAASAHSVTDFLNSKRHVGTGVTTSKVDRSAVDNNSDSLLSELKLIKQQIDEFAERKQASRARGSIQEDGGSDPLRISQLSSKQVSAQPGSVNDAMRVRERRQEEVGEAPAGNNITFQPSLDRTRNEQHNSKKPEQNNGYLSSIDAKMKSVEEKHYQILENVVRKSHASTLSQVSDVSQTIGQGVSSRFARIRQGTKHDEIGAATGELEQSFRTHIDTRLGMVAEDHLDNIQVSMRRVVQNSLGDIELKVNQLSDRFTEERLVAETNLRKQLAADQNAILEEFVQEFQRENTAHLDQVRKRLRNEHDTILRRQREQLEESLQTEINKVQNDAHRQLEQDQTHVKQQVNDTRERMLNNIGRKFNKEQLASELLVARERQEAEARIEVEQAEREIRRKHVQELERITESILAEKERMLEDQQNALEAEHSRKVEDCIMQLREALHAGSNEAVDLLREEYEKKLKIAEERERDRHREDHEARMKRLRISLQRDYDAKMASVHSRVQDQLKAEERKLRMDHEAMFAQSMLQTTTTLQAKSNYQLTQLSEKLKEKRDAALDHLRSTLLRDAAAKEALIISRGESQMNNMLEAEQQRWLTINNECIGRLAGKLEDAISLARSKYREWALLSTSEKELNLGGTDELVNCVSSTSDMDDELFGSEIGVPRVGNKQVEGFFNHVRTEFRELCRRLQLANQRLAVVSQKLLKSKREALESREQLENIRQRANIPESVELQLKESQMTVKQLFAANQQLSENQNCRISLT